MPDEQGARLSGEIASDIPLEQLVAELQPLGIDAEVRGSSFFHDGRYADIQGSSYFTCERLSWDELPYCILRGDSGTVAAMLRDADRVSKALAKLDLTHRLEVYTDTGDLAGYYHLNWPPDGAA